MKITFEKFDRDHISPESPEAIPELTDGFSGAREREADVPETGAPGEGMTPVTFCSEPVPFGTYQVRVTLEALEDVDVLYLFTGRKQLREIISMKQGERREWVYCQSAAEIIPRYHEDVYPVTRLFVSFCTKIPRAVRMECHARAAEEARRIFLCGDSTVTDQSGEIPYHPGGCYAAWGQALPAFMGEEIAVENQAHCGLTTENFEREGHLELVRHHLRQGDLCLFQFGHNDQKRAHLMAETGYRAYLLRFIRLVREWGGIPVLVTPLGRNTWSETGREAQAHSVYRDLLEDYAREVKGLAKETGTPCIDLHQYSTDWIQKNGMERSRDYFHPDDYTHNNEYGAYVFGRFMAGELGKLFPELTIREKTGQEACSFEPPLHVWDGLCGAGYQESAAGEKEQFDRMEKSTAALFQAVQQAKEAGNTESYLPTISRSRSS